MYSYQGHFKKLCFIQGILFCPKTLRGLFKNVATLLYNPIDNTIFSYGMELSFDQLHVSQSLF